MAAITHAIERRIVFNTVAALSLQSPPSPQFAASLQGGFLRGRQSLFGRHPRIAMRRRVYLCESGLPKRAWQDPIAFLAHDRLPPASFIANSSRTHAISVWKSFHVNSPDAIRESK